MRIEINKLIKEYDNNKVLEIDSAIFESGKIYSIMGPNGSGKTTLLRLIGDIEGKTSGTISIQGMKKIDRNHVAYMPQSPYMFDTTVIKSLDIGLSKDSIKKSELMGVLDSVGLLKLAQRKANKLSGGESQRLALARVLILNRKLILLDEPASATDLKGITQIENFILERHRKTNNTIIFTTHNPAQAMRVSDEMLFMFGGKIIEKGRPDKLLKNPNTELLERFLINWRI